MTVALNRNGWQCSKSILLTSVTISFCYAYFEISWAVMCLIIYFITEQILVQQFIDIVLN